MYNFLRYSLLSLILLTVALVSALAAMRMAIHGREVEVPRLLGLSPDQAEQQALDEGLLVQVENRFYSPTVPRGHILAQSPAPGAKVRRGWRVHLTESRGPQQMEVPNVVGQSLRFAELNLRRHGLEPADIALLKLSGYPPDQVLSQTPAANAASAANRKVGLLATPPPEATECIMPSVVGLPVAAAVRELEKAGITVRDAPQLLSPVGTAATSGHSSAHVVVSQRPVSGAKLSAGSSVELEAH